MADWSWSNLINPQAVEGGWQMGGAGPGGLLAQNSQLYPYLGDIGAGLLASSGPSIAPQGGLGPRLGGALSYAGQRQGERLLNDARRMEIGIAAKEQKGYAALAKWAQENPALAADPAALKTAALTHAPELAAKSLLSSGMSPIEQLIAMQTLETSKTTGEAKAGELAASKADIGNIYRSSQMAADAVAFLKTVPGGETIATSPEIVPLLRKMKAGGWDKGIVGESASWLLSVPRDKWGKVLDAAEAIEKARNAISTASSNTAGVAGLQARLLSQGSGAGLNLQEELFSMGIEKAREQASGYKDYQLPEMQPDLFPWRRGDGQQEARTGTGFNPQAGVTQQPPASTVITPQPGVPQRTMPAAGGPAAPAPLTGPTPRPVTTTPIDPVTNAPMRTFPREADGRRAVPPDALFLVPNPANPSDPFVYRND